MVSMSMDIDPRIALAIQQLQFTYASANDRRDVDAIMACFEPDGSFGLHVAGSDAVGPFDAGSTPDLRAFFAQSLGAQGDQRRHVITNVRFVEASSHRCLVSAYLTLVVTDAGRTQALTAGEYTDEVVLREGQWRFARKWLELDGSP